MPDPVTDNFDDIIRRLMGGYSEAELSDAFDRVKAASHWKDPIDAEVRVVDVTYELGLIKKAVEFYTATEATITPLGHGRYRVTADGYRRGPAGDH